jgi:hypothetical protein
VQTLRFCQSNATKASTRKPVGQSADLYLQVTSPKIGFKFKSVRTDPTQLDTLSGAPDARQAASAPTLLFFLSGAKRASTLFQELQHASTALLARAARSQTLFLLIANWDNTNH